MIDYTELKRLVEAGSLPPIVSTLIAENERIDGCCKAMALDMGKLTRERNSFRSSAEKLKAENEALRNAALSKAVVWCACGDGYPANSYGAGFMDANGGVCANCDAAVGSGRSNSRGSEQDQIPAETPVPERSACRSENP